MSNTQPKLVDPVKMIKAANGAVSSSNINKNFIGHMFLFEYDPKLKVTLPYWDKFPLVFPLDVKNGQSMLAINMHYLPILTRARLLDNFQRMIDKEKKTFININYKMIEDQDHLKYAIPCIKRYLFKHIVSRLVPIDPLDWDLVIAAPLDRFQKASANKVWDDSLKKIYQ